MTTNGKSTHVWALRGQAPCTCDPSTFPRSPDRVVVTGGPGAGKTAVLEVVGRQFCEHVVVLPEAASILFRGGFPRVPGPLARRATQRAIFRVQDELETMAVAEGGCALVLCDRGVVDGAAYWPGEPDELFREVGTHRAAALARYAAVVHLRTPDAHGYDHRNPYRVESAADAAAIDERLVVAWEGHPKRLFVDATQDFVGKIANAISAIESLVPAHCRRYASA